MGFSFACPRHRCLLVDLCPRCERIQRRTLPTPGAVPRPAHCANRTPGTGQNGRDRRCGQLLTEATAWALPAEDDVLQAQDLINRVIAAGTADFGLYVAEPQPARAALTDLKTLAGRMLTTGSAHQLGERLPLGLHKAYQLIEALPSTSEIANPPVRLGFLGPPSAVTTAAAAVVGIAPLLHADIHEAGAVIRWLVQDRRNPGQNSPATWATWSTQASPRFYAVQLAALAPGMRPSHQVRHRLGAPRPGPSDHPEQAALRHRKVPALLWPALALRIAPLDGAGHTQFRAALSTLLLLPGNGFEYPDAERLLGRTGARGTSSRVQILHGHRCWPGILTAVVRLADHLDAHAAPIDYHRRRHLDYSDLLPNELWEEVSDQADLPTGRGVRIRMA